jgi:hypothetical protein
MPPTSETKNAYWWNTPRSRGLTRTSGTAAAGIRPPREVVDRTGRSVGIRDSGLGEAGEQAYSAMAPRGGQLSAGDRLLAA